MNDKTVTLDSWIPCYVNLDPEAVKRALIKTEGLRPLCSIVSEYKRAERYDELSKWLSSIPVEFMETTTLVDCLRYTYGVRGKITSWEEFFNDVEQMLIERREDYKSILRGLYD